MSGRSLIRDFAEQPVGNSSDNSVIPPLTPGELSRLVRKLRPMQFESTTEAAKAKPVRGLRRRLRPEVICEIVQRYNGGEYTTYLSREYGISKSGLLRLLRDEGVKLRKQPITPEDESRAVQLYESGLTITQAEERIGYSYGTIRRVLHEEGVEVRPSAVRSHPGLDE